MSKLFITAVSILVLLQDCSKEELILNEDNITVSDLIRYCKCRCDKEELPCNDKEVKVKGHIDYYQFNINYLYQGDSLEKFWLKDFRNGSVIEVYLDTNKKAIIDKIISAKETDMCYIKGISQSFKEPKGLFSCMIITKIILNNENDIYFAK